MLSGVVFHNTDPPCEKMKIGILRFSKEYFTLLFRQLKRWLSHRLNSSNKYVGTRKLVILENHEFIRCRN